MIRKLIDYLTGQSAAKREAQVVLDRYFAAKNAFESAVRRGDTRDQAWTYEKLKAANHQRLRVGL